MLPYQNFAGRLMDKSEYTIRECVVSAGKAFRKNIGVILLMVSILPLPGFIYWSDAPLAILCIELTLLDCFYLMAGVLLIFGIFGSENERISIRTVAAPFLHARSVAIRCWQFFYSEPSTICQSLWLMTLGIVFGLGVQWLAAPWKIPVEQNLIGAGIYLACLLLWSEALVGWMLAPYYLANLDLPANEAYKLSQFKDKHHRNWGLRVTAVACVLTPALVFGTIRFALLKPADFVNYQLNPLLTYLTSIVPWMLAVFSLFLWNEIYLRRIARTGTGNLVLD